jgi:hypothetical protein
MEVSGQLHSPAALSQGKSPFYPLNRRMGGTQSHTIHFRIFCVPFKSEVVPLFNYVPRHKPISIKTYWENGGRAPRVLNLGTRQRWSASRSARITPPPEKDLGTHCLGVWVRPRAGLRAVAKIKKSLLQPVTEPRASSP